MTPNRSERSRPDGSAPFSLRRRASLLYKGRRRRILQEPITALQSRSIDVQVDPEFRSARINLDDDVVIEVGFKGQTRLFGVLIDTMWVGRRGSVAANPDILTYRFDKKRFSVRSGGAQSAALAAALSGDTRIRSLIEGSELKKLRVMEAVGGRQVELISLPGTITAVFIPPLPPYTVPIRLDEAKSQLGLVERILRF